MRILWSFLSFPPDRECLTKRSNRRRAGALFRFHMTKMLQPAATRALARRG